MNRAAKWAPVAIIVVATAGSFLPWSEFPFLTAGVTAGVIGGAIFAMWPRSGVSTQTWTRISLLCLVCGLAAFVARQVFIGRCTGVNLGDERVVTGTRLTSFGIKARDKFRTTDNDQILAILGGVPRERVWELDSIHECSRLLAVLCAGWIPLLGVAALAGTKALTGTPPLAAAPEQQIFLSYNHADADTARRLCCYLREHGLDVVIDSEAMKPGERISSFIERSIRESDVVLSLVSSRSLLSAWVALETVQTLNRNKWVHGRLFIACYLDEDFFRPDFRLEATRKIDERLGEIERLIPEYAQQRIDTVDLNEEKSRLYDLRNNLGTILAVLKDSLCLDVRGDYLEESGRRIVAAVRELRSNTRAFA